MTKSRSYKIDKIARIVLQLFGWSAVLILAAIFSFLAANSYKALSSLDLSALITGKTWFPTLPEPEFGFLPAEMGSFWVSFVALVVSIPIGVLAALYLSEFASPRFKGIAKTLIEFMAAIPSVVIGLIGLAIVVPLVHDGLGLDSGLSALSAGIMVGVVCLPTLISISEDALHAVPDSMRQASAALANNRWQTAYKVVLPAASSGIFAAIMLSLGRAIGETMVVLMLAGNSGLIPTHPFMAARTLTGTIAQETGEVVRGGMHFSVLFSMGLMLFVITFVLNLAADLVIGKQRKKWGTR